MGKPRDLANVVATGNILADGAVAPAELTGVTSTAAELNILDGVTATAAELNIMDGVTATTAELNYVDGVTSNVQTQMDTKAPVASPTFTGTVTGPTINASTALQIGGVAVTATAAELNKMDGVTVSASDINSVTAKAPAASPTFTGDVTIPDKIVHDGDTNTAIRFPAADTVSVETSGSEAMRIDSSGDLLVGKTSSNSNTVGIELSSSDLIRVARSGGATAYLNRKTNDGEIITLAKDGTQSGSIGTNGAYVFIGSHGSSGKGIKITDALLPADNTGAFNDNDVNFGASNVRWKDAHFSGKINSGGTLSIHEVIEKTPTSTTTSGTINTDILSSAVVYYTANQTANRTINFRGDSSTSLNSIMANDESMTVAILVQQGSTAYYLNAYQVDGSSVTPKWQGGSAPTAGNASGIDAYSFTIIKTADATFTVLASQTQFA